MIGTGQYLTSDDISNADAQAFYVVADAGASGLKRDDLLARGFTVEGGLRKVANANYVGQLISAGLPAGSGMLGSRQYTPLSNGSGKDALTDREVNIGGAGKQGRLSWQELVPQ